MIEYIYFVKCPNCEDEPFTFFDEAKNLLKAQISNGEAFLKFVELVKEQSEIFDKTQNCQIGQTWKFHLEPVVKNACMLAEKYGADKDVVEKIVRLKRGAAFKAAQIPPIFNISEKPLGLKDKWLL